MKTFSTGEVALAAGVSVHTVKRVTDDMGIDKNRKPGNHRRYSVEDARKIVEEIQTRQDPKRAILGTSEHESGAGVAA